MGETNQVYQILHFHYRLSQIGDGIDHAVSIEVEIEILSVCVGDQISAILHVCMCLARH